jgi:hypothetical protein
MRRNLNVVRRNLNVMRRNLNVMRRNLNVMRRDLNVMPVAETWSVEIGDGVHVVKARVASSCVPLLMRFLFGCVCSTHTVTDSWLNRAALLITSGLFLFVCLFFLRRYALSKVGWFGACRAASP